MSTYSPYCRGVNWRAIIFAAIVVLLIGYPVYLFWRAASNKGITDRGDYKEVNLKALGNWPLDPINGTIENMPAVYRALDGQKVILVGQWYPVRETGPNITAFQVVWSITNCCFNGPPQPQERVFAFMPPGKGASLPDGGGLIRVFGKLHIKLQRDPTGRIASVFTLDLEKVEGV